MALFIVDCEDVDWVNGRVREFVYDELLKAGLRKTIPTKIQVQPKVTPRACERLVAKIAWEVACSFIYSERLHLLSAATELPSIALGESDFDECPLVGPTEQFSPSNSPPHGPKYFHEIVVQYQDHFNAIDIYFFGCVGFRVLLFASSPEGHGPMKTDAGNIRAHSLRMTFEPGKPRQRFVLTLTENGDLTECCGDGFF